MTTALKRLRAAHAERKRLRAESALKKREQEERDWAAFEAAIEAGKRAADEARFERCVAVDIANERLERYSLLLEWSAGGVRGGGVIVQHNGVVMVIERRWWHVRLTFEIDGIVGQETSLQWASSDMGACATAGIELGIAMATHAATEALLFGKPKEPYRYQLKFMEWTPASDVEEESP